MWHNDGNGIQSPLPYSVGWKQDPAHTQEEGLIEGHVHLEAGIMVGILKSVRCKTNIDQDSKDNRMEEGGTWDYFI